jgi:hypothetical protein
VQQIWDYPPYPYLEQVLISAPAAAYTYMKLWSNRNPLNITSIEPNYRYAYGRNFKQNLLKLCNQGLINVDERPSVTIVELVGWDHEDD